MEIKSYLLEVNLKIEEDLNKIFNFALGQVFTNSYVEKINKVFNDKEIEAKEVTKNQNFIAYAKGKIIYINKPAFYAIPREKQIRILMHEFINSLPFTLPSNLTEDYSSRLQAQVNH
jgi:Ca2+-binding EF-hand superfamily protein